MKEVLHVISGKRLPVVFHVGARALTSQALNIHAGHDDVMAVADTGWGILFARSVQEVVDLTAIARRVAEETETPFLVVQDGFLTTHTLENARLPEDELLREFVGDPRVHIRNLFEPAEALMSGVVQNQDSYMKGRVAQRSWYARIPGALRDAMTEWQVADRPPLRIDRHLPDRGRRAHPRRDGHHRRQRARRRRSPARRRRGGGCNRCHQLPAVPGSGACRGSRQRTLRGCRRADGRARRVGQPADARDRRRPWPTWPPMDDAFRGWYRRRPGWARATCPRPISWRCLRGSPTRKN